MRFYTASKLGSKRGYTPEGFLVCYDVPIARTGEMLYVAEELNSPGQPKLIPGPDGLIRVLRSPDEVFDPEAIASFVGKPTTNNHPPVLVTPANFSRYAAGAGLNIRRGAGDQSDLLLADLIFSTAEAIAAIENGKIEISNGYDADYEQDVPGIARQINIRGNHIALVDEGRCGTRCAIGDSAGAPQQTVAAETLAKGGAAGIALRNASGELLFLKRRVGAPHGGTWCFPGGSLEQGETPEQAARRELAEEAGIKAGPLHLVDTRDLDDRSSRTFSTFTGDVEGSAEPRLNDEHDAFRWASPNDPPQPLHPGVAATLREKAAALTTKVLPSADRAPAPNEAPSCGCGGHHRDAIPADQQRTPYMPKVKRSAFDRLRAAFAMKDEKAFEQEVSKVQDDVEELQEASEQSEAEKKLSDMISAAVSAGVKPLADRMDAIEAKVSSAPTTDDEGTPEQIAAKAAEEAKAVAEAAAAAAATAAAAAAAASEDDVTEDDAPADMGSGNVSGDLTGGREDAGGGSTASAPPVDDSKMTADAAGLAIVFRDTVARAEILAPGVKLPTYDGKKTKKTVADSICALRREALKRAFASDDRKAHVAPFVTDAAPDFAKFSCGAVKLMFAGASELAKAANNHGTRTNDAVHRDTTVRATIKDLNDRAKALWKK